MSQFPIVVHSHSLFPTLFSFSDHTALRWRRRVIGHNLPSTIFFSPLPLAFISPSLSSDWLSLTLKQESLLQWYTEKDETAHHGVTLGDNYGWSNCLCVCVSFVWKSPRSIFCGQTEGSGKVDHVQYLMAHYLFMSPTIHGPLGKNAVCVQRVH